ncbi:hypothetical protein ACLOJK_038433 [Asimina triloba]
MGAWIVAVDRAVGEDDRGPPARCQHRHGHRSDGFSPMTLLRSAALRRHARSDLLSCLAGARRTSPKKRDGAPSAAVEEAARPRRSRCCPCLTAARPPQPLLPLPRSLTVEDRRPFTTLPSPPDERKMGMSPAGWPDLLLIVEARRRPNREGRRLSPEMEESSVLQVRRGASLPPSGTATRRHGWRRCVGQICHMLLSADGEEDGLRLAGGGFDGSYGEEDGGRFERWRDLNQLVIPVILPRSDWSSAPPPKSSSSVAMATSLEEDDGAPNLVLRR